MNTDMTTVLKNIPEHDSETDNRPDYYKTRSGVVLKLRRVAPLLLRDVARNFPNPKVPLVPNLEKGDNVLEENPNDPAYLRAVREQAEAIGDVTNGIILVRGSEVVSVPDSVSPLADTQWSEDVQEFSGLEVPDSGRRRYLCWLKYVVLDRAEDFFGLVRKISALSGMVMEEAVAQATEEFRGDETRGTNNVVPFTPSDRIRDSDLKSLPRDNT